MLQDPIGSGAIRKSDPVLTDLCRHMIMSYFHKTAMSNEVMRKCSILMINSLWPNIESGNGLSPVWHQAIFCTTDLLFIGILEKKINGKCIKNMLPFKCINVLQRKKPRE